MTPEPGDTFPDLVTLDHAGRPRSLSELAAGDPLVLTTFRGFWCPKEQAFMRRLVAFQDEVEVAYTSVASLSVDPPEVTMTLYLYNTCHVQNGAVYSVDGTIVFDSLFSGNRNENRAADRLTDAHFQAVVADPRDATLVVDPATNEIVPEYPPDKTSIVKGDFRFYFQRGEPAQPFQ